MDWSILRSFLHCPYKAWQLAKDISPTEFLGAIPNPISLPINTITPNDRIVTAAWYLQQPTAANEAFDNIQILYGKGYAQTTAMRISKYARQAKKLLGDIYDLINKNEPPSFYKNAHCHECQFKDACHKKLKERDCISLLAGMTPKVLTRYKAKGITTITQLSHIFRPRRRKRIPHNSASYSWELKALAIREQKTFILYPPDTIEGSVSIYIDFEGLPDENWYYLLGGIIKQEGKPDESFSFWADNKDQEADNFDKLFSLFLQYPDATIYHYGSYEHRALKHIAKISTNASSEEFSVVEQRMVNLLGYLRTHVYPPTYSNGLKELGKFLGFQWRDAEANGLLSIEWRIQWENTLINSWKEKLLEYNQDDCKALIKVHQWFCQLANNNDGEHVQQVAQMKRHTPYNLRSNPEYGEDFQVISKAAYFDYQRTKIYWRGLRVKSPAATSRKPKQTKKGAITWQPKKVHEVIVVPQLKKCPHCGATKLYQSRTTRSSVKQTDLRFTPTGIRQHVIEYKSGNAKCAKCYKKFSNRSLRIMHYGDNLFALVAHYYVNYHISNEMISKLLQEQYGIWVSPMYLVMYKYKWWRNIWEPEVNYIKEIVLRSPVIHIDETTIQLAKERGYVWVFATTHTVFYHYTSTREVDFLQDLLRDYEGVVVSDFFPGYETLPFKRQKCLIHLIRDLNDDLFKNPFDEEYKEIVSAFSKLLRKIIETIDRYGLVNAHLKKHLKDTEIFYKKFVDKNHKSELSIKYAKRLKKHWEQLWTFLHFDNIPWNNNNAEAAIKAFAQHRRGVKGQMHEQGIRHYLQMLSVAQTCRYRNISFLSFLRHKKGIWENIQPEALPGTLPFGQAKLFVHRLKLKSKVEWNNWKKQLKAPAFIPLDPEIVYEKDGWIDWDDWLGLRVP